MNDKTKVNQTKYGSRRSRVMTFLHEHAANKAKAIEAENEKILQEQNSAKFTNRPVNGKLNAFRRKLAYKKSCLQEATDVFLTSVIRKALPYDVSHISNAELREQVRTVVLEYSDAFSKTNLLIEGGDPLPASVAKELSITDPDHLRIQLGGIGRVECGIKNTPINLAKQVIYVNDDLSNNRSGEPLSIAMDVMDSAIVYGSDAEAELSGKSDNQKKISEVFGTFSSDIASAFANSVKSNVVRDIQESLNSGADHSHLSEGMQEIHKKREKRMVQRPSVVSELFKNLKTLNESFGASEEDYLNEAVFQATVLEAYNMVGLLVKDGNEVCSLIRNKRFY